MLESLNQLTENITKMMAEQNAVIEEKYNELTPDQRKSLAPIFEKYNHAKAKMADNNSHNLVAEIQNIANEMIAALKKIKTENG